MKMTVIGCGYLGAVHAACLAHLGHEVVGIDIDDAKVEALSLGRAPFYEPGFAELVHEGIDSGRLRFTTDGAETIRGDIDLHFVTVGTPQDSTGAADLRFLMSVVDQLAEVVGDRRPVVVGKSTVPVGTAAAVAERLEPLGAAVAWNPEFLREGTAVEDTLHPSRIVYGLGEDPDASARARAALDECYRSLIEDGVPLIVTDYATSELVKVAANAFLATKISYINAMGEVCDEVGADVATLSRALGFDDRIGHRAMNAGIGFGGGCLPKDIRAFVARADELNVGRSVAFLKEVDAINLRARERAVDAAVRLLDGKVEGATVAVLGAAFKPHTDDVRDSPALDVATSLQMLGARVRVTDPIALGNAAAAHPELTLVDGVDEALDGADVVLLATDWPEYVGLDPAKAGSLVRSRNVVDGRNALELQAWKDTGWTYVGIGR